MESSIVRQLEGQAAELELEAEAEEIDVYCWRMEQLLAAGYTHGVADALAAGREVDLHEACRLLAAGCPEQVAFRILY